MKWINFLIKAKRHSYADGGSQAQTLADGCRELVFVEGDLFYRDRYFGFDPFIGEEVLFFQGKAVWAMNYWGGVSDMTVDAGVIYHFLQQAMQHVAPERPFRGPHKFVDGDYEYRDESQGSPDLFRGEEKIFYRGKQVYSLLYHGGTVS